MAKVDWNQNEYESGRSFETLPRGRYLALVGDSESKPTKKKDGSYFEFEFDVIKPEQYKNRKLWARLNVSNPSKEAERIGREQFNALVAACGLEKGKVSDTTMLHNKILVLIVDVQPSNVQGRPDVNVVTGFLKASETDQKAGAGHKPAPKPATPAAKAAAGGLPDDDIPF